MKARHPDVLPAVGDPADFPRDKVWVITAGCADDRWESEWTNCSDSSAGRARTRINRAAAQMGAGSRDRPPRFRRGTLMSTWFNQAVGAKRTFRESIGRLPGAIIMAAGLGLGSLIIVSPATATEDDQPSAKASSSSEGSVLVATRQSPSAQKPVDAYPVSETVANEESESLEPVSEVAEHSPELATASNESAVGETAKDESKDAGEFGAALAKIADNGDKPKPTVKRSILKGETREVVPYEPATFHGIEVGKSTKPALLEA
jgi:hypothetical protein